MITIMTLFGELGDGQTWRVTASGRGLGRKIVDVALNVGHR